jgi:hypothetical protein
MPYSFIDKIIAESECIGDSLGAINNNYVLLDTGLANVSANTVQLSSRDVLFKAQFNTLIQTLTGFANTSTTYNTLSTSFRSLSSLILT